MLYVFIREKKKMIEIIRFDVASDATEQKLC